MQKIYLQHLNNLIFKIAKRQNDVEYRTMMKYSKHINKLVREFNDDIEDLKLKFADKVIEGSDPRTGLKNEYNIVSASKEKEFFIALKNLNNEDQDISIDIPGYKLFLLEIGKLSKEEITKENKNEQGDIISVEYDYTTQLVIDELREISLEHE